MPKRRNSATKKFNFQKQDVSASERSFQEENSIAESGGEAEVLPTTSTSVGQQGEKVRASRSAKKLEYFQGTLDVDQESGNEFRTCIVETAPLEQAFASLACPKCSSVSLVADIIKDGGFSVTCRLECQKCAYESFTPLHSVESKETKGRKASALNKDVLLGSALAGLGHGDLETFTGYLGMPCISESRYGYIQTEIGGTAGQMIESVLAANRAVIRAHFEKSGAPADNDCPLDITISYDGSWQKRGFTSLYGIGCIIEVETGLVVDYHVLSKYCQSCKFHAKKWDVSSQEYQNWYEQHRQECQKNWDGSSPAMEAGIAKILWARSIEIANMRYVQMISDGDAKSHATIVAAKPYGENVTIEKVECTNHIAKRLGTGLRNIAKKEKLGGKKEGALTEVKILKLTGYYASAIKRHSASIQDMKRAIYGSILHCSSSDGAPRHEKCPSGPLSWCFYNRAIANGKTPPAHKGKLGTHIKPAVFMKIMPCYQRLSQDQLLTRCLGGRTQNSNESLHALIWKKVPKHKYAGRRKVEIGSAMAIALFSQGTMKTTKTMKEVFGGKVSKATATWSEKKDRKRVRESDRRETQKEDRKRKRVAAAIEEEAKKASEGGTYGAGEH